MPDLSLLVLFETLAGNFMGVTQYDESPNNRLSLEKACKILTDKEYGMTAFDRYANLSQAFLKVLPIYVRRGNWVVLENPDASRISTNNI